MRRKPAATCCCAVSPTMRKPPTSRSGRCPSTRWAASIPTYPQLVAQLSFTEVKDYDDWIARLRAIPNAFDQVMTNMSIGMDDHRVPPKYLLEKTLDQVKQLANQKPEDSPLAVPLKKFPASISASRTGTDQGGDAIGDRQAGVAGLSALCPFHGGDLHPGGPRQTPASPPCPMARSTISS